MIAIERRNVARILSGLIVAGAAACFMIPGPGQVAREFWEAVRDGDHDTVEALSLDSRDARLDLEDTDARIESIEIGDARVDGDEAEVETRLSGTDGDVTLDVEFETLLVRRGGEWYVDLDRTGSRLVAAIVGASMEHLGRAIGEGLQAALDGLADGLDEVGRALGETGEDVREESGGSR